MIKITITLQQRLHSIPYKKTKIIKEDQEGTKPKTGTKPLKNLTTATVITSESDSEKNDQNTTPRRF